MRLQLKSKKFNLMSFFYFIILILSLFSRLLKANRHIDEKSASVLLERALIVADNKLEFSRDIRFKQIVSYKKKSFFFLF